MPNAHNCHSLQGDPRGMAALHACKYTCEQSPSARDTIANESIITANILNNANILQFVDPSEFLLFMSNKRQYQTDRENIERNRRNPSYKN